MVFFNCDACGESLKKNQVEKHYMTKCRSCNVLSCVDCGKEFVGDAFKEHIKCITEEEKYSGKNYKPKANANKGERKQELWTEQVQQAIGKAPANNPKLKALLNQLIEFPNIPRKKAKFENFLKNSMRVREPYLITQAWDALSAGMTNQNPPPPAAEPSTSSQPEEVVTKTDTNGTTEGSTEEPKKLSKREKKEERRKQNNKTEKKDKGKESRDDEKSEKKRKRKHEEMEESEETIDEEPVDERQKSKKKKHKQEVEDEEIAEEEVQVKKKAKKAKGENGFEVCSLNKTLESDEEEAVPKKFKLDTVIFEILNKSSEKEMVIKKLIKKVQAAFLASGGGGKGNTEEKMLGKLQKRLGKSPKYTVHKNRVKLVIDTTSDD